MLIQRLCGAGLSRMRRTMRYVNMILKYIALDVCLPMSFIKFLSYHLFLVTLF